MTNKFTILFAFLLYSISFVFGQNTIEKDRVAYYALDGDGADQGKYKNDGEIIGTPEIAENRFGEKEAIYFDGDDWMMCSPNPMSIRANVSISIWVKTTDSLTRISTIVGKYDKQEAKGFNIIMRKGRVSIGGRDGERPPNKSNFRTSRSSRKNIADGKWHHIIGMVDEGIWSIYVDGLLESQRTFQPKKPTLRNTALLAIGNASFVPRESKDFKGFIGAMDDLMFFNRALTEEEIDFLAKDNFVASGTEGKADDILKRALDGERTGAIDSAIVLFDRATVFFKKLKNEEQQAFTLAMAAKCYLANNNVAMAIEKNLKSLFYTSNLKKNTKTKNQLLNLAQHNIAKINLFNGELDAAKRKLNFKINTTSKNNFFPDEIAKIYLTKAEVYFEQGEYWKTSILCKDSVLLFLKNESINKKIVAENHMLYGRALIAEGKTQEGLLKLQEALLFFQTVGKGDEVQVVQCLKYLAEGYQKLNNKERSLELIQTALIKNTFDFQKQSFAENPSPADFIHKREGVHLLSLKASGLFNFFKSNPKDTSSLSIALRTCYIANELLATLNDELNVLQGPRMEIRRKFIDVYKIGIQVANELYQIKKEEYYIYQAFYFSEMSKNFLLLEAVLGNIAKSEKTLSNDLLEKERALRQNYFNHFEYFAELQNQDLNSISKFTKEQENQLTEARKTFQEFSYQLQNEHLDYQRLRTQPIVAPFKDIREKLKAEEVIIEYSIDAARNQCYILLISKENFIIKKMPWSQEIEAKIDEFYQLLQDPVELQLFGKEIYESLAFQLYQHLLAPVSDDLRKYKHLKIILEGVLNYVPFEALLTNNQSGDFPTLPYLLRKFEISYHYSTTLMNVLDLKKRTSDAKQFFGFAPIQFSVASKLAELKASEEEIETIGKLFQQSNYKTILTQGAAATQGALKNNFNEPHQIFHIASHTNANLKFPLYSEIACADGLVKIGELYNLKLQADLLVLSSCKSGVGKLEIGEGMQGLNRNFIAEGVPNILFSLWEVDDVRTKDLMIAFYKNVLAGENYATAIQKSKLKLIQQVDVVPTFWAGFIFVGQ